MPHSQFNFLAPDSFNCEIKKERPKWIRITLFAVLFFIVVGIVASIPFLRAGYSVYTNISEGRHSLELGQSAAEKLDIREALMHLEDARVSFVIAREGFTTLHVFGSLPVLGKRLIAAENVLEGGTLVVVAIQDVLMAMQDIFAAVEEGKSLSGDVEEILPDISTVFRDITTEEKRRLLAALARNASRFASAGESITAALVAFDRIDYALLGNDVRDTLEPIEKQLRTLRDVFVGIAPIAEHLPPLLGYPDTRRYLVFFQNNTELRPTGGFLGVYGNVIIKSAELISVETNDIYSIDAPSEMVERPAPPGPIAKYIGIDKWYLRDANWSPDFPTSASVMEKMFREESRIAYPNKDIGRIDGIIALTPELAVDILRLIGPIEISGKVFTPENFVDLLEFEVEQNFAIQGIPVEERKLIIGKLLDTMVGRLTSLPLSDLMKAVSLFHENLQESHILLSMNDPVLQRVILDNDWGGALQRTEGDYFNLIDANLASLKTDAVMHRTVDYSITPVGNDYEATLVMRYDHRGSFDWKTTRYRTYTRAYVPLGSELIEVKGAMENDRILDPGGRPGTPDIGSEFGKTWFGAFISVEPRQVRTLEFRYKLPEYIAEHIRAGTYKLYAEKQPGTTNHRLTLDLDFGKKVISATPGEMVSDHGNSEYTLTTDLRIDREFSVSLFP